MARVVALQIPGLRESYGRSPLYQEKPSPCCSYPSAFDRCKKGVAITTKAYSRSSSTDYFSTLGVSPGTSKQDIKKAYRRLALQYHPDVCKGDHCTLKFRQIQVAYEEAMSSSASQIGGYTYCGDDYSSVISEGLMGVNDDSWEEWEEWMGWEGAGTRDYTSHINIHI